MAYFLILATDRPEALDDRMAFRQDHIEYWNSTSRAVKVAGAMLDGDRPIGSALLIEAPDEEAARALMADDPFTRHGIFGGAAKVITMRPAIGEWLPGK